MSARTRARGRRSVIVVLVVGLSASFLGAASASGATGAGSELRADTTHVGLSCTDPQRRATVVGKPRIHSVPSLTAVAVTPYEDGLAVSFLFRHRLVVAPAGVLLSWRVFIYRNRHDVDHPASALTLNVEDRGSGWEPSGWTITAALGTNLADVDGNVVLNRTRDELSAFFPKGFGNMRTPFYWYANELAFRSFLPSKNKPNYSVNGSESFDCPAGTDASGVPDSKLLLHATG